MSALATIEPSRHAIRPAISAEILQAEIEQRKLLGQYIDSMMTEGVDYGVIPGTKNKTLLKPGAEKLIDLFRCYPQFTIVDKVENWETGLFHYMFKCEVLVRDSGMLVAEGFGSCSTYEGKYRWRNEDRKCPQCGVAAILKSKYPPKNDPDSPPGFYCFAKKGGCGAEFAHDDPEIIDQRVGKVQNPDISDQINTVLKMAKKRAVVDAAIALARCSDMFTQDAEDFIEQSQGEAKTQKKSGAENPPRPNGKPASESVCRDMLDVIASPEFEKNPAALWQRLKGDYETLLTPADREKVTAAWNARKAATIDPKKSAEIVNTMTAAYQECKTEADVEAVNKLIRANYAKLTDPDKKILAAARDDAANRVKSPPVRERQPGDDEELDHPEAH